MNQKVISFFQSNDPILYQVYCQLDLSERPIVVEAQSQQAYFTNLCESIVSQQLSVKASDTIWKRFLQLLPTQHPEPAAILDLADDDLRTVGLSRAKAIYIKALATAATHGEIKFDELSQLRNEEVIQKLTWVKGIGRWTAEMFIMFTLGREDIFSLGDLGLRNAIQKWYGSEDHQLSLKEIEALSQRWSPYRTYAARILWRSLEQPK